MLLLILAKLTGRSSTKALFSNRHDVLQLVLFAFFGMGMSQLTYFAAVKYSNAPTATVIQYLAPVIIIGYTAAAQKMMPRRIDVVSIIVALVGTFLLVTNGNLNHLALSPQACFWLRWLMQSARWHPGDCLPAMARLMLRPGRC